MADYVKKPQIFLKRGMNVTLPGDRLSQEWFQYTQNVRCFRLGEWRQRPGMTSLGSVTNSIYHLARMNDNQNNTFRRFVGTSVGEVWVDDALHSSFSIADTGYDGLQYSSIISRPDRSPAPYLFMGSAQRNSKFDILGNRSNWGLAAPITPLEVDFRGGNYKLVSFYNLFTNVFEGSSSYSVSAGAIGQSSRTSNIFPGFVVYDDGGILGTPPGMASITLTSQVFPPWTDDLQIGMVIDLIFRFGGPPLSQIYFGRTIVEDIMFPIADTVITGISYDNGVSGPCTITLETPTEGLRRRCLVSIPVLGPPSENALVQVLSVTRDQDGFPSFRCDIPAGVSVGDTVEGVYCFRGIIPQTFIVGSAPLTTYATSAVSNWTGIPAGIQTATATFSNPNLAIADVPQGGINALRSIQGDDIYHISIKANYTQINEIQVQFDINDGTFTNNYYFISLRQPDLFGAYIQSQLAIQAQQTQVTRDQLDQFVEQTLEEARSSLPPQDYEALGDIARQFLDSVNIDADTGLVVLQGSGTVSVTNTTGTGQWTEVFVPIDQFQKVGTGIFDWTNVQAVRISVNNSATTDVSFGGQYIRGTYGPNSRELIPYTYCYRARNTATGGMSNPSPPTRYATKNPRGYVRLTVPSYPDSQADVIDIFRVGGILDEYYLVGTIPNGTTTFFDIIPDSIALRNPILLRNKFKPWVSSDLPKSGTCNVVGTTVLRQTGDPFDTQWVRGTQIKINERFYSLYTNPSSTDFLTINESAGTQTDVNWQIIEPVLDGQPLPAVFGPYSGSSAEFNFAVGDPRNPGYLYWTNGNDTESTSDTNAIEICPPSERLMNGCVLDGVIFVFSDKGSWRVLPSFEGGQTGGGAAFFPQKTAMGKGLASRWGLAVGDALYFVSYDGIYRSRGDAVESITDDSLAPIFRRDISEIVISLPIAAVSFDPNDINEISLAYSLDGLYFTYRGIDGNRYTLYFSFLTQGWTLDSVAGSEIMRTHREVQFPQEDQIVVGMSDGQVLIKNSSVFLDNGQPISCRVYDREELWDTLRGTKQVGDTMIDADPQGATITPTMHYDNDASSDVLTTLVGSGRTQYVRDINSGLGRVVRGAAIDLTWTNGGLGAPRVYAWEPAALIKPEESVNRVTDWDNGGYTGTKWLQGFRLRGDTEGLTKSFEVQQDGGTTVEAFDFTTNGEEVQTFWLTNPVVAHEMRIAGTDGDLWRNMGIEWIFEPEPEMAAVWETQVTSFDLPFYMHMREVMIAHRSTSDITMNVITDGVTNSYTIPNSNGERVRSYLPVQAIKAKYHKFRFTSAEPFGLWMADIECRVGPWGRTESYTIQRPFGDISRTNGGARI